MAEPKPIASLSSGLLARKGAARPAMRRQGHTNFSHDPKAQEDLGWNDMGYDVDPPKSDDDNDDAAPFHHGSLLAGAIPPVANERPDAVDPNSHTEAADDSGANADDETHDNTPLVVRQRDALAQSFAVPEIESESVDADENSVEANIEPEAETELDENKETNDESVSDSDGTTDNVTALNASNHQVLSIKPVRKTAALTTEKLAVVREARVAKSAQSVRAKGKRAAFTLRVDPDRHLRLRLASAITGRSAQHLVTEALDELLTKIPEIENMADSVSRTSGRK